MITIGFKRFGNGIFVPHVDVLRNLNRTFRRAEIDVGYSKGYVRHMKLKLTQPLPFGVADDDGYVTADVEVDDVKKAIEDFNENCPPFLRATSIFRTEKNLNLAGLVDASEYFLPCRLTEEQMEKLNRLEDGYVVSQQRREETVQKSTEGLILSLSAYADGLKTKLAFGNVNLRVDLLLNQFNKDFLTEFALTDVVRTGQYLEKGKTSAKDYMLSLAQESYFIE